MRVAQPSLTRGLHEAARPAAALKAAHRRSTVASALDPSSLANAATYAAAHLPIAAQSFLVSPCQLANCGDVVYQR